MTDEKAPLALPDTVTLRTDPETSRSERIGQAANHLRFAAMNLMIAGEEDIAEKVDELIEEVDRCAFITSN